MTRGTGLEETATPDKADRRRDPAGLLDFQAQRKANSRERLLAAASAAFCEHGYLDVSVEDIVAAAGVSRMTFYRHFSGKADLASALFHASAEAARPYLLSIRDRDHTDTGVVREWLEGLFSSERERRHLLRAFVQANAAEAEFTADGHDFLTGLAADLGQGIPAFAASPAAPGHRRQWVEGWMLLYEILDQSNHAARDSGVARFPEALDILAERFTGFVRKYA